MRAMTITELGGYSIYHVHLHLALTEAVKEHKQLSQEMAKHLPLTEQTVTTESVRLHYSLEQKRIAVILLAAACVEALANLFLATKTTPEQFAVLDATTVIDKWVVLPALFLKDYTFPRDTELYRDLKLLNGRRNTLLHLKATITEGGKVIHAGNPPKAAGDEDHFTERCGSLPNRLVEHIASFDPDSPALHALRVSLFHWPQG